MQEMARKNLERQRNMMGQKGMHALPELRCKCGRAHCEETEHSPNRPMGTLNLRDILEQSHTKSLGGSAVRTKASSNMTDYPRPSKLGGNNFASRGRS